METKFDELTKEEVVSLVVGKLDFLPEEMREPMAKNALFVMLS